MRLPWLSPSPPQVWAVEDTAVQITWGDMAAGPVAAVCEDRQTTVEHGGGPGSLILDGLDADRQLTVELTWSGGSVSLQATTVPSPPGPPLSRFATISDLHLGAQRWGALKTMNESKMGGFASNRASGLAHPYRCARAAISDRKSPSSGSPMSEFPKNSSASPSMPGRFPLTPAPNPKSTDPPNTKGFS